MIRGFTNQNKIEGREARKSLNGKALKVHSADFGLIPSTLLPLVGHLSLAYALSWEWVGLYGLNPAMCGSKK